MAKEPKDPETEMVETVGVELPPEVMAGELPPESAGLDAEAEVLPPEPDDPTICSREAFRRWYAGRFRLVNMLIGPMIGGKLQSLQIEPDDPDFREVADQLYDEALRNRESSAIARFLLRPVRGTWSTVETQGGFLVSIAESSFIEIQTRLEALRQAQAHQARQPEPERGAGLQASRDG